MVPGARTRWDLQNLTMHKSIVPFVHELRAKMRVNLEVLGVTFL